MTFKKLKKAAEEGNAVAQCQLAAMLATGDGCDKDTTAAAKWYKKAASKRHPEAMYNLGLMYLLGELRNSDQSKGISLIEKSAEYGSWDAQWFLAEVYAEGAFGLERNPSKAAYYSVLSLRCKYGSAALALGLRLRQKKFTMTLLADAFVRVGEQAGERAEGAPVSARKSGERITKKKSQSKDQK